MVFASAVFLFLFFPVTLGVYFFINPKYRNGWLCAASFIFYAWGGLAAAFLILFSTVVNYFIGLFIDRTVNQAKRKWLLILALIYNLGALGFFKYFNFLTDSIIDGLTALNIQINYHPPRIALPIGISFFTFQIMSYVIDLYRKQIKVQKNIVNLGLYIMLFPQLIAGPIVRYVDVEKEISNRQITIESVRIGLKRFILGLAKKMILANAMGEIADYAFQNMSQLSTPLAWAGIFGYTLQIFFDFSAYSDMAIGLGRIFGFHFLENFNYPYIALSMQDFWRRWHMSLTQWFRDYLYIPLGGNRKGKTRTLINNSIVFFCTGLWHGAAWNYIIWGMYHGIFMLCEKKWGYQDKLPKVVRHIYVLIIVMIGWVFFRADNLSTALLYLKQMFTFQSVSFDLLLMKLNPWFLFVGIMGIVFSTPIAKKLSEWIQAKIPNVTSELFSDLCYTMLFLLSLCFVSGSSFNPFIYFKF